MLYILIRTCPRDDYIGRLAYESFYQIYPNAKYLFLAESGPYTYTQGPFAFREKCDNFGGQHGARVLLQSLKDISIHPDPTDMIFLVDSDIVLLRDIEKDSELIDHGGICGTTCLGLKHVSGQFQIMSGSFFNQLISLSDSDIVKHINDMLPKGMDIADDTVFSYISDVLNVRKQHVSDGWVHYKFYEYTGITDYQRVINEVRSRGSKVV